MSDGDSATPGRRRAPEPAADNPWVTRTPPPSPLAAPWERARAASADPGADRPRHADPGEPDDEPSGQHTDGRGVSVADLIAKVGSTPHRRPRRRAAPDPEPEEPPAAAADVPGDDAATALLPTMAADDLPDLTAASDRSEVRGERRRRPEQIDATAVIPKAEPKRERRRMLVAGRALAALFAVGALAVTGGAYQWQSVKNQSLNNVAALDPDSRDILDPNAQFGDENFLIVGVDTRAGANSELGAGDQSDAAGARSDTVMLVNIPANRQRVVAVSFPRDLQIEPMKCQAWNADTGQYGPVYDETTGSYGPDEWYTETKLNSAYAYGGPKCLVKVIQKLSGININRFMAIDFAGFSKMVDALGGVEVCSTTPLEDYELGTVLPNAGRQVVDGHTALNYVRARQVTTEVNGDYGRIKRQQLFLSSLIRSMISREVFFSLNKLNNVVNMFINDSYVDNIQTKDLVQLGQSIQGISAGRVTFITVPTTGETDEMGNEIPREDDIRALFDAIIQDKPLPGEDTGRSSTPSHTPTPTSDSSNSGDVSTAASRSTETPPAQVVNAVTTVPGDVTVRVSNSTGRTGLGATAASELQQHGFHVTTPDDYPNSLPATTVFFSAGNEQAAATVAAALPHPQVERVSGLGGVVQVVLGPDFSAVSAPPPSGSTVQVEVHDGPSTLPTDLPEDLSVTNAADTSCD
ncbi:LCP family protein [Mycobacterium sp. MYCO198283]|uniref:LCP family protein n=1 Tax=Mycobacterium sp. MYCO198283 TaxID=2883505 RepID=UPI001E4F8315|nr:LCP family protein [Mycobacterium sp. MYCO198283]MCG5431274.1 LCP family protein [Mycobacterium sp. MYCO198283]